MSPFKLSKVCQIIGLSLLSLPVFSSEQPEADSLVGQKYIGFHGMYIKADNDRLFTTDANSNIDHGTGIGGEFGYRITPSYEARISATTLNLNTDRKGFDVTTGSSVALDLLYFPYKQSFYTVFGADFLDIDKSNLSGNLGAGYRYHLSHNSALYIEGKGHYQFDDNYVDYSTKIGFVYYFDKKPAPIKQTEQIQTKYTSTASVASVALKDSDKDGVSDAKDKCPDSQTQYKVNNDGCTVYMKRKQTMELLVNFDNDESAVSSEAIKEIAKVAEFMKSYRQTQLTIHGHTSSQGKATHNLQLSQARAQAIVDVLVNDFSIAKNRLTAAKKVPVKR